MRALDELLTWPVPSAAGGVIAIDALGHPPVRGAGADGFSATAGEVDQMFAWASVTKLCTALAVLVAIEEGAVALADPLGPPGSTVAHLLAHASGLAPTGKSVLAVPGSRRIYSNSGYEVLGAFVATRTGFSFRNYLDEAVLRPLGMGDAHLDSGGSPGSGMVGTMNDLLSLGRELLTPTIVDRSTLSMATDVAFPGIGGVLPGFGLQEPCDWGLGFEIKDGKSPHWTGTRNSATTFGHFGRSGSFLWVDPDIGVACGGLADRDFGQWAIDAWPRLSDAVVVEIHGSSDPNAGHGASSQASV